MKGMPILGPMLEEKLFNSIDANGESHWVPLNNEATELACCLEACKQSVELRSIFGHSGNLRSYTLLTTPAWNLVEHTLALHRLLGKKDRSSWKTGDAEAFTQTARSLRKLASGPFKKIRNQRSAHNDPHALLPSSLTPVASADLVLPPMREALAILILSLNHDGTFAYCRLPDPSKKDEVQVMFEYPVATLLHLDAQRKMDKILEVQLAADPRHEASQIIEDTITFYNDLASKAGGKHFSIVLTRHEKTKERFKDGSFKAKLFEVED